MIVVDSRGWFRIVPSAWLVLMFGACAMAPRLDPPTSAWRDSRQMIVVDSEGWDAASGTLRTFERRDGDWIATGFSTPVTLGRAGSAWGIGLHPPMTDGPQKREGDGRAPAGVFALGTGFGYDAAGAGHWPHVAMSATEWCIDVPGSPLYNRIVDSAVVGTDAIAGSTEPMRRDLHLDGDDRYRLGFVIGHNEAGIDRGGSCIFAHLWGAPGQPTAGCTAMDEAAMRHLLDWLRSDAAPRFVLMPRAEYARVRASWDLPPLDPDRP